MSELSDDLESARDNISSVIEQLDDLIFRELRRASARGDQRRPEVEKRMTRARNALVRASLLLFDEPTENESD